MQQPPPDFGQMMKNLQKMQESLVKMQGELDTVAITGTAGGGAVQVECTGSMKFTRVRIKKEAVDPEDIETLEDLVLTAVSDAMYKAQAMMQDKATKAGLALPPGMGF